jgi:hypothetical protein
VRRRTKEAPIGFCKKLGTSQASSRTMRMFPIVVELANLAVGMYQKPKLVMDCSGWGRERQRPITKGLPLCIYHCLSVKARLITLLIFFPPRHAVSKFTALISKFKTRLRWPDTYLTIRYPNFLRAKGQAAPIWSYENSCCV